MWSEASGEERWNRVWVTGGGTTLVGGETRVLGGRRDAGRSM